MNTTDQEENSSYKPMKLLHSSSLESLANMSPFHPSCTMKRPESDNAPAQWLAAEHRSMWLHVQSATN